MPDTQRQRRQGGRPRKAAAERQSKCVFVWLTPTEHEAAREGAASSHESLSAFGAEAIRQRLGADGPPPASADNAELAAALGQLVRIGNNLNQLTRSLNSIQRKGGAMGEAVLRRLEATLGELRQQLIALQAARR